MKFQKKAVNGSALDKMIILESHSCTLFLPNLTKEDYYYAKQTYFFLVLFIITFFDCITFVLWINIYIFHYFINEIKWNSKI
jgi:hypothetical protein